MLHTIIKDFLDYSKAHDFSSRSLEVFSSVLNKFSQFINSIPINSIRKIGSDFKSRGKLLKQHLSKPI
jgi:hypothetical protein